MPDRIHLQRAFAPRPSEESVRRQDGYGVQLPDLRFASPVHSHRRTASHRSRANAGSGRDPSSRGRQSHHRPRPGTERDRSRLLPTGPNTRVIINGLGDSWVVFRVKGISGPLRIFAGPHGGWDLARPVLWSVEGTGRMARIGMSQCLRRNRHCRQTPTASIGAYAVVRGAWSVSVCAWVASRRATLPVHAAFGPGCYPGQRRLGACVEHGHAFQRFEPATTDVSN